MSAWIAFTKKELLECIRTHKFMILLSAFAILGFMNPIMAKYMPTVMESFLPDGMVLALPEPTVMDSWAQFFKNVVQIGIILFLLMVSTILSSEFQKGTLINMVTKGCSRTTIYLAKLCFLIALWSVLLLCSTGLTLGYGMLFWEEWNLPNLAIAIFCVWMFGAMCLSILCLGSVVTRTSAGGLIFVAGIVILCFLLSIVPDTAAYNPITLISENMTLLQEAIPINQVGSAMLVSLGIVVLATGGGLTLFHRVQL